MADFYSHFISFFRFLSRSFSFVLLLNHITRYDIGLKEGADNSEQVKILFDTITTLLRSIRMFCTQDKEVNGQVRCRNTALEQSYALLREIRRLNCDLSIRARPHGLLDVNLYNQTAKIVESFEEVRVVRDYPTPKSARQFYKLACTLLPILLAPAYVGAAVAEEQPWSAYLLACSTSIIFGLLAGVEDALANPFNVCVANSATGLVEYVRAHEDNIDLSRLEYYPLLSMNGVVETSNGNLLQAQATLHGGPTADIKPDVRTLFQAQAATVATASDGLAGGSPLPAHRNKYTVPNHLPKTIGSHGFQNSDSHIAAGGLAAKLKSLRNQYLQMAPAKPAPTPRAAATVALEGPGSTGTNNAPDPNRDSSDNSDLDPPLPPSPHTPNETVRNRYLQAQAQAATTSNWLRGGAVMVTETLARRSATAKAAPALPPPSKDSAVGKGTQQSSPNTQTPSSVKLSTNTSTARVGPKTIPTPPTATSIATSTSSLDKIEARSSNAGVGPPIGADIGGGGRSGSPTAVQDRSRKLLGALSNSSTRSSLNSVGSAGGKGKEGGARDITKSGAIGRESVLSQSAGPAKKSDSLAVRFGPMSIAEYDDAKPTQRAMRKAPPMRFGPMTVDEYDAVKPLRRTSSGRILIVSDDDADAVFSPPPGRRRRSHSRSPKFSAFESSQTLPTQAHYRRDPPVSRHGFSLGSSADSLAKQLQAMRKEATDAGEKKAAATLEQTASKPPSVQTTPPSTLLLSPARSESTGSNVGAATAESSRSAPPLPTRTFRKGRFTVSSSSIEEMSPETVGKKVGDDTNTTAGGSASAGGDLDA